MNNDSAGGWFRLWHDMTGDPKWRVVARKSKQPLAAVIAVAVCAMTNASLNSRRGDRGLVTLDPDEAAAALDLEPATTAAILKAFRGVVTDDDGYMTGWDKRQPLRPGDSSAERTRRWRGKGEATDRKPAPAKLDLTEAFDAWWKLYPRKTGKGEAEKCYARAIGKIGPGDPAAAIATLRDAVTVFAALSAGKEREYIPHPSTWLNGMRWLDDDVRAALDQAAVTGRPASELAPAELALALDTPSWRSGQSRMTQ